MFDLKKVQETTSGTSFMPLQVTFWASENIIHVRCTGSLEERLLQAVQSVQYRLSRGTSSTGCLEQHLVQAVQMNVQYRLSRATSSTGCLQQRLVQAVQMNVQYRLSRATSSAGCLDECLVQTISSNVQYRLSRGTSSTGYLQLHFSIGYILGNQKYLLYDCKKLNYIICSTSITTDCHPVPLLGLEESQNETHIVNGKTVATGS